MIKECDLSHAVAAMSHRSCMMLMIILCCGAQIIAAEAGPVAADPVTETEQVEGPRVAIQTNHGRIVVQLDPAAAPETVARFVALVTGQAQPPGATGNTERAVGTPFYDGLTFHRVIPNFMIQGGCPLGNGSGDPGFRFADEFNARGLGLDQIKAIQPDGQLHPMCRYQGQAFFNQVIWPQMVAQGIDMSSPDEDKQRVLSRVLANLKDFTLQEFYEVLGYEYNTELKPLWPKRGSLCMANSGPNTNGSQFFINLVDTPHLAGKHTVFGQVIEGFEVVEAIAQVERGERDLPTNPVIIENMVVVSTPPVAPQSAE